RSRRRIRSRRRRRPRILRSALAKLGRRRRRRRTRREAFAWRWIALGARVGPDTFTVAVPLGLWLELESARPASLDERLGGRRARERPWGERAQKDEKRRGDDEARSSSRALRVSHHDEPSLRCASSSMSPRRISVILTQKRSSMTST